MTQVREDLKILEEAFLRSLSAAAENPSARRRSRLAAAKAHSSNLNSNSAESHLSRSSYRNSSGSTLDGESEAEEGEEGYTDDDENARDYDEYYDRRSQFKGSRGNAGGRSGGSISAASAAAAAAYGRSHQQLVHAFDRDDQEAALFFDHGNHMGDPAGHFAGRHHSSSGMGGSAGDAPGGFGFPPASSGNPFGVVDGSSANPGSPLGDMEDVMFAFADTNNHHHYSSSSGGQLQQQHRSYDQYRSQGGGAATSAESVLGRSGSTPPIDGNEEIVGGDLKKGGSRRGHAGSVTTANASLPSYTYNHPSTSSSGDPSSFLPHAGFLNPPHAYSQVPAGHFSAGTSSEHLSALPPISSSSVDGSGQFNHENPDVQLLGSFFATGFLEPLGEFLPDECFSAC